MVKALVDPVMDGAVGKQAGKAALAGFQQGRYAAYIQKGILLSGKAGGG